MEILVVIGEDYSYKPPTLEFCKKYAHQMGLPLDRTFIDSGPETGGWEVLFGHVNPYLGPNGEFALPWEAVLDADDMEYLYCSSNDPYHNVMAAISEAMKD